MGLDKDRVFQALINKAKPNKHEHLALAAFNVGLPANSISKEVSLEAVRDFRADLNATNWYGWNGYAFGKSIKIRLSDDDTSIWTKAYDKEHGDGAALSAINSCR